MDLIERRAAIDAMGIEPFAFSEYENGLHDKWEADVEALMNLPSAQPDVHDRNVGEWDMFDLITSAYYGKMMYSKQDNGIVYSRYSCKYMSMDEAIREFLALIGEDI